MYVGVGCQSHAASEAKLDQAIRRSCTNATHGSSKDVMSLNGPNSYSSRYSTPSAGSEEEMMMSDDDGDDYLVMKSRRKPSTGSC